MLEGLYRGATKTREGDGQIKRGETLSGAQHAVRNLPVEMDNSAV